MEEGSLPSEWLKANVSPIFKKGGKSNPANYRPISLTCILCKIFEHIIASNVVKHFDENQILYDLQHGFRSKRSCETQLTMLIEEIHRNLKDGKQTDIILLDFSKAFDKVNHEKLIFKLHLVTGLEVKPYHGLRHSLMAGHKLWSWRGIVLRRCQ